MIESGDVPESAALQGFYDDTLLRAEGETSTGFPRVPVVCSDVLATWAVSSGQKRMRFANVAPADPSLEGYSKQVGPTGVSISKDEGAPGCTSEVKEGSESLKVKQARRMVEQAMQMRDEANVAKVRRLPLRLLTQRTAHCGLLTPPRVEAGFVARYRPPSSG